MIARLVVCRPEQMGEAKGEVTLAFVLVEREAALTDLDCAIKAGSLIVPEPAIGFDNCEKPIGAGEFRIGRDRALKTLARQCVVLFRVLMKILLPAKHLLICVQIAGGPSSQPISVAAFQPTGNGRHDGTGNFILKGKDIDKITLIALRP